MNKSNEEILLDQDAVDLLKSKIGGGEQVAYYRHIVDCITSDPQLCYQGTFRLDIINTSSTELNYSSLKQYLIDNGYQNTNGYPCLISGESFEFGECTYFGENDDIEAGSLFINDTYNEVKDTVIPFTPEANA